MAQLVNGRPIYVIGDSDFHLISQLDHLERERYRRLREIGLAPHDALAKAREIEDPLPELGGDL